MPPLPSPNKPKKPEVQQSGTVIETDEEIQNALREGGAALVQPVVPASGWEQTLAPGVPGHLVPSSPCPASPPLPATLVPSTSGVIPPALPKAIVRPYSKSSAVPYRPTIRPPVAELTVFDDGKTEGEMIRVRSGRFIIGRTEGDLLIPHDELISTRHVEITRQQLVGGYRWVITDLQSTNGLFIRVSRTNLANGSEFLVGSGRYRFDAPEGDPVETVDHLPSAPGISGSTRGWEQKAPLSSPPALAELVPGGIGNRIVLVRPEYWIGTDSSCDMCRPSDPFCELKHVRVSRNSKGGWQAVHHKTLNGLWYRVSQTTVESTVSFLIGEQRFRLRV